VANPIPTAASDVQATQDYYNSLGAIVIAATTALADPTISRQQAAAERQAIQYAQAAMLLVALDLTPDVAPVQVVVQSGDTLFSIAQARLGSALKYTLIQQAQKPPMVGTHIDAGQILILPASQ
jgi:nucleoid-associated protein YgaU